MVDFLGTLGDALSQKTDNPHMRLLNGILQALRRVCKTFLCVLQEFEMTIIHIVKLKLDVENEP